MEADGNRNKLMINVTHTAIEGVCIIEPKVFGDERGYFYESFSRRDFEEKVGRVDFCQDNQSFSHYGVLRGLHFQKPPYAQAKLVRVIEGRVVDVAVDIRKGSPTFGRHVAVELSGDNHRQFFIPRGFAHGFVVLSETALFQYKCDNFYHPEAEGSIAWDDPDIAIAWPVPRGDVELSAKDGKAPSFKDFDSPFEYAPTEPHPEA